MPFFYQLSRNPLLSPLRSALSLCTSAVVSYLTVTSCQWISVPSDKESSEFRTKPAPGQYLGYSLQVSRMLDHLLSAGPGTLVSLEVIGDVSVENVDGNVLVEESKSRTSVKNPISDRAEPFWKTFRNWVQAVIEGTIRPEVTQFRLFVSRDSQGTVAKSFSNAETLEQASAALMDARTKLLLRTTIPNKQHHDQTTSPHLNYVLEADPGIVQQIIQRFQLDVGSGRSLDDLRLAFEARLVPPAIVDEVLYHTLGWLKAYTDSQIEQGHPATVLWDDFRDVVVSSVRRLDRRDFLASVAKEPSDEDVKKHLEFRTYVQQLALIEVDDAEKIRAVTDFIKAEADRVAWADKGRVVETSFDEFESELGIAWGNYRRKTELAYNMLSSSERGKLLYAECFGHRSKLDGTDVPEHFGRGSFHRLSDGLTVGWHPDYTRLLQKPSDSKPTLTVRRSERARGIGTKLRLRGQRGSRPTSPKRSSPRRTDDGGGDSI